MKSLYDNYSLNATTMKLIAVFLMVLDHIYQMFSPLGAPVWLNWLGRPVLIIFLFIVTESFHHTSNRKAFLLRLLLASCLMSVFNQILGSYILPNDQVVLFNNAFAVMFVTGLYMLFWDILQDGVRNKKAGKILASIALFFLPILTIIPIQLATGMSQENLLLFQITLSAALMLPNILFVEGGPLLILLGVLFYVFRTKRLAQVIVLVVISAVVMASGGYQWLMVMAAIPILLYNGEKGRGMKHFFYIIYPTHIYLLYIIATLILTKQI